MNSSMNSSRDLTCLELHFLWSSCSRLFKAFSTPGLAIHTAWEEISQNFVRIFMPKLDYDYEARGTNLFTALVMLVATELLTPYFFMCAVFRKFGQVKLA
jgi:hypothetical protein